MSHLGPLIACPAPLPKEVLREFQVQHFQQWCTENGKQDVDGVPPAEEVIGRRGTGPQVKRLKLTGTAGTLSVREGRAEVQRQLQLFSFLSCSKTGGCGSPTMTWKLARG